MILIDYAEFNLVLAGIAKRAGVPVLYYITPQVWAWRRGRIRKIVERSSRLAVVLPFEKELYGLAGDRVSFVGHPLLDRVVPAQGRDETLARHGLPEIFQAAGAAARAAGVPRCATSCPRWWRPRASSPTTIVSFR